MPTPGIPAFLITIMPMPMPMSMIAMTAAATTTTTTIGTFISTPLNQHMPLQRIFPRKTLITMITRKRLDGQMNPLMSFEIMVAIKALPTYIALEWPLRSLPFHQRRMPHPAPRRPIHRGAVARRRRRRGRKRAVAGYAEASKRR